MALIVTVCGLFYLNASMNAIEIESDNTDALSASTIQVCEAEKNGTRRVPMKTCAQAITLDGTDLKTTNYTYTKIAH